MIARFRHSAIAIWLALAAMLAHGLVPNGYMLGRSGSTHDFGFMLCSGGLMHAAMQMKHGDGDDGAATDAGKACAFAAAAMHGVARYGLTFALTHDTPFFLLVAALPSRVDKQGDRRPPATGPPFPSR
ncbi:DUF2946 family protein [Solimonas marina]|uniref:DUF2946 domain-containing protein n=1 Tax=Solimonas marina TaxID=2714601 RepID=A0A970BAE2_9GAMM|nr:DUF2946 family protein [Solimonas marina]NKF24309.1 hypothetical protein [Solimonas marina]